MPTLTIEKGNHIKLRKSVTCKNFCRIYGLLKRSKSHMPLLSSSSWNRSILLAFNLLGEHKKESPLLIAKTFQPHLLSSMPSFDFDRYDNTWLKGMEGLNFPTSPVMACSGSSQIRKNPKIWSILYAVKYFAICQVKTEDLSLSLAR